MDLEKQKKFLINIAYWGVLLAGAYLAVHYLGPPLTPFIIGFLIAWVLRAPTEFLAKKFRIKQKFPAMLLSAVFYIVVCAVIFFLGAKLISGLKSLVPQIPDLFKNQLLPLINSCAQSIMAVATQIDPDVAAQIGAWFSDLSLSVTEAISSISSGVVKIISSIATATPDVILKVILTVVSSFYFSVDFVRITGFVKKVLPQKIQKAILPIKDKVVSSLKIYVRSYTLIFLLTFAELSVGFLLLKVPHAVLIALIVAVIDLMPVLGTGLVLLPWAIISAIMGNIPFAIGMAILYVAITAIRNIVEPKLVGEQIGLYPLATLIGMFVGLHLFGFVGMFGIPVTLSVLVQFKKDGVFEKRGVKEANEGI